MRSPLILASLFLTSAAFAQPLDGGADVPTADGGELSPALPQLPNEANGPERIGLTDAINRALKSNPNVVTAFDELKRSYALLEQTRSSWMPTVNANATYTRLDSNRILNGNTIAAANQFNANLTVAAPLFNPRLWLAYGSAEDLISATNANAEDAKRVISVSVGRAYLTILAQHRIIDANLRALAAAQAHRDFAAARLRGGVGNRIDLVRAQQTYATDEALVESARTNLVRAQEALGVLIGESRPFDVLEDVTFNSAPTPDQAEHDLKQRRLDLEALDQRAKVADDVVRHKWADYVPFVNASLQPFFQTPASLTTPTTGWQAAVALTWPIFDGGLRYGQEREREILAHEAHVNAEGAERQARSEVRSAFESVQHADTALVSARAAAKLARDALELVNTAYHAGATTNIEVIDAERSALDAETQAAVAEDTARQARLDLLSATGRFPYDGR